MIESDETGQKQIEALYKSLDDSQWNEWEHDFIKGLKRSSYAAMSTRKKAVITKLYAKLQGDE